MVGVGTVAQGTWRSTVSDPIRGRQKKIWDGLERLRVIERVERHLCSFIERVAVGMLKRNRTPLSKMNDKYMYEEERFSLAE